MVYIKSFSIIGGDMRQVFLASILCLRGYEVTVCGFDSDVSFADCVKRSSILSGAIRESQAVILPLPVTLDNYTINATCSKQELVISEFLASLTPDKYVFGGKIPGQMVDYFKENNIRYFDYLTREEFAIYNAVPTAEGALQIAMEELPHIIKGTNCLVTGYGRISKVLSSYLRSLGARVTISARKPEDLAWISSFGYYSLPTKNLKERVGEFDVIFNTVPAVLFNKDVLTNLKPNCLLIDLASKPGGIDFVTAGQLGIKTIWALSLPGKVAPQTSGEIIADIIECIIKEV